MFTITQTTVLDDRLEPPDLDQARGWYEQAAGSATSAMA
jgi:hypothetical protein